MTTASDYHPHAPLHGPFAWHGAELAADRRWQYDWSEQEKDELQAALEHANHTGVSTQSMRREDFPLHIAAEKLRAIATELERGCGMVRIRGLRTDDLDQASIERLWLGICLYLGTPVYQDHQGQLVRRICDEGARAALRYGKLEDDGQGGQFLSSRARTATTAKLRFHTDRTDVVGLLCTGVSRSGGGSQIASSVAVHNRMLEVRPDLAALLYQPIWRSRLGEESHGQDRPYPLPVFAVCDGQFTSHYSRTYVEAAQLNPQVPKMTDAQWEALDLLADLAKDLAMTTQFQAGDMQFINSHVTYHARDSFEDDAANGYLRCLYRVWVCAEPLHRRLPPGQDVLWQQVEPGFRRGGIALAASAPTSI